MVAKQLPLATKQYSSLTAADCRQLYYQQVVMSVVWLFVVGRSCNSVVHLDLSVVVKFNNI